MVLLRYENVDRWLEDFLFAMEVNDALIQDFEKYSRGSKLGQAILKKEEEERQQLFDIETQEAAYRKKRSSYMRITFGASNIHLDIGPRLFLPV